jgi:MFS family permease
MPQTNLTPQAKDFERDHKRELYAVSAGLSVLGVAFATWASRVPDIRDAAFLTAATLGYALMMRGGGNILMMPLVATLINKFGAKKTTLVTGTVVIFSLFPLSLMNNWIGLGLLLLVVGAGSSGYNIAINALGSRVEAETGKSHMSKIHSWFGIGNLSGALIGVAALKFGISVQVHFGGVTLLLFAIVAGIYRFLPEDAPHPEAERPKFEWPHGGLIAIGIICFLASAIEGSMMNWVGLFFTDHVKVDGGYSAAGYTAFAGAMLLMRLVGDRLKTRFGARAIIITGTLTAATGILISIFAPGIVLATFGMFLTGGGVAFTFPMVFSAAGREGAIALTSVATFGYLGGMVSQPVMGIIVENFELMGGFLFLATCCLTVAILASRARLLKS